MHLFLCNKSSRRQIQCLDQMTKWSLEYTKRIWKDDIPNQCIWWWDGTSLRTAQIQSKAFSAETCGSMKIVLIEQGENILKFWAVARGYSKHHHEHPPDCPE